MSRTTAVTLLLLALLAPVSTAREKRPPGWIGISFDGADCPEGPGLRVSRVWGESPGARAGLRQGDIVLTVNGKPFTGKPKARAAQLKERMKGKLAGDQLTLRVYRVISRFEVEPPAKRDPVLDAPRDWLDKQPPGTKLAVTGKRVARLLTLTVTLGRRPGLAADASVRTNAQLLAQGLYPLTRTKRTALERLNEQLVTASGSGADYADLLARLAAVEAGNDGFRVELVRYVHRDPFRLREVTEALLRDLREERRPEAAAVRSAFGLLTGKAAPLPEAAAPAAGKLTVAALLSRIEQSLGAAAAEVERAFARMSAEERKFLAAHLEDVVDALDEGIYLFNDRDKARRKRVLRILALARKLDYDALRLAVARLDWLVRPGSLERTLRRVSWPAGALTRSIVASRETRWGQILIGGSGRNWYRKQDAAVIIDLGGDDFYTNNTGASVPGKLPVSLVVDLGGDDAYESHRRFTQGCGAMGVGLLIDRAGDDSYIGTSFSQGCGYLGVGLLIDDAGHDTYRGLALHQGVGLWGVGALIDKAGNDRYTAQLYSQGVGLSHGVGLLHDLSGDDRYYAKGKRPTGYGTPGVFDAWSQGCGLGFRLDASGGVGLLVDGAGADRYEGGNFSQGGGYYYAWGLLHDAGRADDVYIASRYGQGWSAHQAVGTFVEAGGNDRYTTRNAVNSGLAWDQSVTLFLELGGNDTYQGGGFSQGASAHNSICLFLELGGTDHYSRVVPARAGGNSYHGGTSWSLFIDAGGGRDTYATQDGAKRYRNGARLFGKQHYAFCDLDGTVRQALSK